MSKYTIRLFSALFLCALFITTACNKKDDSETTKKDSLEQITKVPVKDIPNNNNVNSEYTKDSTDIYGTGDFSYRDSLQSFHRGYSIPRDSVYKVWNTKAYQELELEIKKHPMKPGPYLDRANHFQNIKMYPEAIADYNKYIGLYSSNPSAYMNRGNAHERLKSYDSAMADYQKVIELKPDDTIANFNKGNIYDMWGKYDMAIKEYDTVIIKDHRLAKAYYNRGASYLAVKNYAAAVNDWETAIKLNPVYEPDLQPRINKIRPLLK
jgi:tetratricopeptide (TPR) repeat protein